MKAVRDPQRAIRELAKLLPDTAEIVEKKRKAKVKKGPELKTKVAPVVELREGNLGFVRPAEKIPADGAVREGISGRKRVTGERRVKTRAEKHKRRGGCRRRKLNSDGKLTIGVAKNGEHILSRGCNAAGG